MFQEAKASEPLQTLLLFQQHLMLLVRPKLCPKRRQDQGHQLLQLKTRKRDHQELHQMVQAQSAAMQLQQKDAREPQSLLCKHLQIRQC